MTPKLTDDAVSRLPLHGARAELLEEIMSTATDDRPVSEPIPTRPSHRRWLVPLAAAAVVAGIAVSSLWWRGPADDPAGPTGPTANPSVAAEPAADPASRQYAVLTAPGWTVQYTESYDDYGSASYAKGDQSFEITTYPADSYDGYVEDREHIVDPPAPGTPVEVLGRGAQMWAYSRDDHAAIREVEDGHWMELRGSGMDEAAYVALLGRLELVDRAAFEASLPDRFVTDDERLDTALQMVAGMTEASGADWPGGASAETFDSDQQDPYQLGAEVAGRYACAWLEDYTSAQQAGDAARAAEAVRVLGTSRDWPVLQDMAKTGFYSQTVWGFADQIAAGEAPEGFRGALGCP